MNGLGRLKELRTFLLSLLGYKGSTFARAHRGAFGDVDLIGAFVLLYPLAY